MALNLFRRTSHLPKTFCYKPIKYDLFLQKLFNNLQIKGNLEKFKFELRNQVEINSMCKNINKLYTYKKRFEWGQQILGTFYNIFFLIIVLRKMSIWQACLKFIIVKKKLPLKNLFHFTMETNFRS